jgi:putative transposase
MKTVEQEQDIHPGRVLPPGVQGALGELAGAAKEGLLALSVGVGLGVLSQMMEAELEEVVGPKHAKLPGRAAVRHGHEDGEVTLGGRRVPVKRPRARTVDDEREVPLETYAYFADRDPLTRVVLEQMLAGVSTRRFSRTREPVGEEVCAGERSASKSAVSREFVGRTRERLTELMRRDLQDVRLAVLMVDGIELKGRCCIVALGISTEGVKIPLGFMGRLDGEQDRHRAPPRRLGRPGPGCRAGRTRRPGRQQGTRGSGRGGLRARPGAALCSPQGTQRPGSPPRTRPSRSEGATTTRVGER